MKKVTILSAIIAACLTYIFFVSEKSATKYHAQPSHIDDRQWHRWLMRGGEMDPQKMMAARHEVQQRVQRITRKRDAGMQAWSEMGPRNVGGRIRAIALQPNGSGGENIFIGAAGGGIWRSTNGGASWTLNDDIAQSMAITSIITHPTNTDILYASTGEGHVLSTMGLPGAGIFKTVDGGDNWTQLSSTNNDEFYWVNKLAINPVNGQHVLAVTADYSKQGGQFPSQFTGQGKLKESTNGGATWTDLFTISNSIMTDVEFHPNSSALRLVSGHGTLRVYNSTTQQYDEKADGDVNELPDTLDRIEVAFSLSSFNTIYALANSGDATSPAHVYRSLDGGATWTFRGSHPDIFSSESFGNYSNTIVVDPTNANHIYLGGVDLWKSSNGGASFSKISDWTQYHAFNNVGISTDVQLHADQHIMVPALNYTSMNKKMYIGNDGGIMKTDDISSASANINSSGWDDLVGNTLGITQFYAGAISPHTDDFAGGAQDNGVLIANLSQWKQPSTGDGNQVIFHPTNSNIVFANVNYNKLLQSVDGGTSFTEVAELGENEALLIAPMAMNTTNPNLVYLGGKALWQFNDASNITTLIKNALPPQGSIQQYITSIAVDSTMRSIWIGYSTGEIEYSTNGGSSWSGNITSFILPNTAVTDIDILPSSNDGLDVIVSFGGYRPDNIWKHTYNGINLWSGIPLDFDMQVNTLSHHPIEDTWIYAGTDVGVFASEDYGQSWSVTPIKSLNSNPIYDNDGPTYTEISDLFWRYGNVEGSYNLCAATFGRGIWLSNSVLEDVYVNRNDPGPYFGTRPDPYRFFTDGITNAQNTGASLIFLGAGTHNEIGGASIYDKRVLITSELESGFSAVIE